MNFYDKVLDDLFYYILSHFTLFYDKKIKERYDSVY